MFKLISVIATAKFVVPPIQQSRVQNSYVFICTNFLCLY